MEKVLSHTRKVLVNDKSGNLMVPPLDQMPKGGNAPAAKSDTCQQPRCACRRPQSLTPAEQATRRPQIGRYYRP